MAKGFGWATVPQLKEPIGAGGRVLWLLAGLLVLPSAALIAVEAPTWWWLIAACRAPVSPVGIVSSWSDARAGTLVNVLGPLASSGAGRWFDLGRKWEDTTLVQKVPVLR